MAGAIPGSAGGVKVYRVRGHYGKIGPNNGKSNGTHNGNEMETCGIAKIKAFCKANGYMLLEVSQRRGSSLQFAQSLPTE